MARRPPKPEPAPAETPWVPSVSPIRGAWQLMRARPGLWVTLSIPYAVSIAAGMAQSVLVVAPGERSGWPMVLTARFVGQIAGIAALLCGLVITAAMGFEIVAPRALGARQAFGRVGARLGTVVGVGCVLFAVSLPVGIVVIVWALRSIGQGAPGAPMSFGPGSLAAWFLLGLAIAVRFGFAFPATILSPLGVGQVFRHTWDLTRGESRRLVPYYLLLLAPPWLISTSVNRILVSPSLSGVAKVAAALLGTIVPVAWTLFGAALVLQLWYRLRAEKDGMGLERAAREMGVVVIDEAA